MLQQTVPVVTKFEGSATTRGKPLTWIRTQFFAIKQRPSRTQYIVSQHPDEKARKLPPSISNTLPPNLQFPLPKSRWPVENGLGIQTTLTATPVL